MQDWLPGDRISDFRDNILMTLDKAKGNGGEMAKYRQQVHLVEVRGEAETKYFKGLHGWCIMRPVTDLTI
jgi:hypothetical protein